MRAKKRVRYAFLDFLRLRSSLINRLLYTFLLRTRCVTSTALELDKLSFEGFRETWLSQRTNDGFPNLGLIINVLLRLLMLFHLKEHGTLK